MRGRRLSDLVHEHRAAIRQLEDTRAIAVRAREAAAHMTEQLGFQERLGQRRAVDGDELRATARAAFVNQAGDDLFAGSALPGDEHLRVAPRRVIDLFLKSLDNWTRADELGHFHRL